MTGDAAGSRGASAFGRLGRAVVRRPLVPIAVWLVLVLATVPFLSHLGSVTTSSADSTASNAPSALAAAKLAQLFPNTTGGSSTIVLLVGPGITEATGQRLVMNITDALGADRRLVAVASIANIYTEYAGYLAGQTRLAAEGVAAAQSTRPNLTTVVRANASLLWGPPALFFRNWEALVNASPSAPRSANLPAYNATAASYAGEPEELAVLNAFYGGYAGSETGFNGSAANCAADYPPASAAARCADQSATENLLALVPSLPNANATAASWVLSYLGVGNASNGSALQGVADTIVGATTGQPAGWVGRVWTAFPDGPPSPSVALAFAEGLVAGTTLTNEPLAVPLALSAQFVNPAGTASLITVTFSVSDQSTNASGGSPVFADLGTIQSVVTAQVAQANAVGGSFQNYQTGPAPLDQLTNEATNSSLELVLPLTVGLLLGIAMIYFRSPVAPLVAFAALGIALLLGLGGTVLIGTFITHVNSSAIALEEVFVLGIGTDYSIFLVARYREELTRGRPPEEAIVAAVTWAGQSIATSGSTAILVTLALTFSGVALLAEWGMVLSIAILATILVALTLLPALVKLVGPRIFWPYTKRRFAAAAAAANERVRQGSTYFYRAGRRTRARPAWIVAVIVLVSLPIVVVALGVPISYDFYDQLPNGHMATVGLAELGRQFGDGFAVPSYALVTFAAPLLSGNTPNLAEFGAVANLTALAGGVGGIATVRSPVGPYGTSLAAWERYGLEPPLAQENLRATLAPYLGTDGRTVLFQLQPTATGLSSGAVTAVRGVESRFGAYAAQHPGVTALAFGGGAPTISDLADETSFATEVMIVAVMAGLILVLLAVLRSWIIALLAVATIGLSISWAWALTDLVLQQLFGIPIFFYVRTILIMLVLGLGIDYNIFLLTRIREERLHGRPAREATVEGLGRTGGIITAAAVILASAFSALLVGDFTLIRAIGFSVAVAVVMDAMVVRTYLVPATLQLLGERAWSLSGRRAAAPREPPR